MYLFDGHLDLACLEVEGREMALPLDRAMGPHPPAAVTLPALTEGGVRLALATIFTEAVPAGSERASRALSYEAGDAERAHARGLAQLEVYRAWAERGLVKIDVPECLAGDAAPGDGLLHVGILMENADPVRTPDELAWWSKRGVIAVGMAWWASSRYAAGNGIKPEDDFGVSGLGRELVGEIDRLGLIHDQSHLSDGATRDLLELTDRPIVASHSNCRSLLAGGEERVQQRHLSDETIREIVRRGGVIGLNLVRNFIRRGLTEDDGIRPSVSEAIDHVEHICDLAGSTEHVALGTDMDGGISADDLPAGIDRPGDLVKLVDELRHRGWNDGAVAGFAHGNWRRFLVRTLGVSAGALGRA